MKLLYSSSLRLSTPELTVFWGTPLGFRVGLDRSTATQRVDRPLLYVYVCDISAKSRRPSGRDQNDGMFKRMLNSTGRRRSAEIGIPTATLSSRECEESCCSTAGLGAETAVLLLLCILGARISISACFYRQDQITTQFAGACCTHTARRYSLEQSIIFF